MQRLDPFALRLQRRQSGDHHRPAEARRGHQPTQRQGQHATTPARDGVRQRRRGIRVDEHDVDRRSRRNGEEQHGRHAGLSASHEPTQCAESYAQRERLRELLLRAPADMADRLWRRRGAVLLCQARLRPEGDRAKTARVAEAGDTADAVNFRGMVESLFGLRDRKEVIFRNIMYYL